MVACYIYHRPAYLLNAKKQLKTRAIPKRLSLGERKKLEKFLESRQETGSKGEDRKSNSTRQNNKRADHYMESNDSHSFQTRGVTSKMPGLPSTCTQRLTDTCIHTNHIIMAFKLGMTVDLCVA